MDEDRVRAIVREEMQRAINELAAQHNLQSTEGVQKIVDWFGNLVDFDTLEKTVDTMISGMDKRITTQIKAYDAILPQRIVSMMNTPRK